MISIATCLWDANGQSQPFSKMYDETWVDKLYRGFARNLTTKFDFYCFVDRPREFREHVIQYKLKKKIPDYGCFIEPYKLHGPLIVVGLDTIIVGNLDHIVEYFGKMKHIATVRDPYKPEQLINPFVMVPDGYSHVNVYEDWTGENDMEWLRYKLGENWHRLDVMFPDQIVSLKFDKIRATGLKPEHRVVYFHGHPKPNELLYLDWVKEHWR